MFDKLLNNVFNIKLPLGGNKCLNNITEQITKFNKT